MIDRSHYKWEQYPALRFDFVRIPREDVQEFKNALKRKIENMISVFTKKSIKIPTVQEGLETLVVDFPKKNRVVVLVDEYDYVIINSLKNPEIAERIGMY